MQTKRHKHTPSTWMHQHFDKSDNARASTKHPSPPLQQPSPPPTGLGLEEALLYDDVHMIGVDISAQMHEAASKRGGVGHTTPSYIPFQIPMR